MSPAIQNGKDYRHGNDLHVLLGFTGRILGERERISMTIEGISMVTLLPGNRGGK